MGKDNKDPQTKIFIRERLTNPGNTFDTGNVIPGCVFEEMDYHRRTKSYHT